MVSGKKSLLFLSFALFLGFLISSSGAEEKNMGLPTMKIQLGNATLTAEIAKKPEEHRLGLMNRKSLPEDSGMLFVFEPPRPVAFWMKNTFIPLSAAFVAADGTVVKMADMEPLLEKHHSPDVPIRYVIEVNRGWFKKAGIKVGDTLPIQMPAN